jgi:hypothetical protein
MFKIVKLLMFLGFSSSFVAQNTSGLEGVEKIFPGSPEAYSMTKVARTPVDYYSGLPKIDIPLLELEARCFNLPIKLNYHAAGIKVNEISSSVGLGWNLNAGGVLTRVVRGKNDDDVDGYVGGNLRGKKINESTFNQLSNVDILNYSSEYWDSEPDVYYFNFMESSGRFVLDKNGKVIMTPENDFKVYPAFGPNSSANYWTIVDKFGVRYKFGISNSEKESSKIKITNGINTEEIGPYVSSWYLSEIEVPGKCKITFSYKSGVNFKDVRKSEEFRDLNSGSGFNTTTIETETISPKILERVNSELGYVKIDSSIDRLDFNNMYKINKLELFDYNNKLIKGIILNQNYFNSINNCNMPNCKRLKLESVLEFFPNSNPQESYSFIYNSNNLPNRDSFETDHWGYYNANGLNNLIPRTDPYNINFYRQSNVIGTRASILKEIHLKEGGYTKYNYELNTYFDGNSVKNGGGLRISSIENIKSEIDSPNIVENFSYLTTNTNISSGKNYDFPIYLKPIKIITGFTHPDGFYIPQIHTGNSIMSSSCNSLFDLNGSNVGYSEVSVNFSNNGSETYKFTDLNSNPDLRINNDFFNISVNNNFNSVTIENYNSPFSSPFSGPSKSNSYQRGLLKEKITKNSSGEIILTLENFYQEKPKNINLLASGIKFSKVYMYNHYDNIYNPNTYMYGSFYTHSILAFNVAKYNETNGNYRLTSTKEKKFYNGSIFLEKIVNYSYSLDKPTSLIEKIENINGDVYKSKYEYADSNLFQFDFDIIDMKTLNMIDFPIVETVFKNNYIISKKYNEFYSNNNNPFGITNTVVLKNTYKLEIDKPINNFQEFNFFDIYSPTFGSVDSRLKVEYNYSKYDGMGNLLEFSKNNGVKTCLIWGYNNSKLIAKIENLNYTNISQAMIDNLNLLSNADNDDCFNGNCNEQILRNALNNLRNLYPESFVTTYTYNPLIGVTSITDVKGKTEFYQYDKQLRLKIIRDNEGNILKGYGYNYKNN